MQLDAAASIGAGWIETDIQCLADGELVIFTIPIWAEPRRGRQGSRPSLGATWLNWMWVAEGQRIRFRAAPAL